VLEHDDVAVEPDVAGAAWVKLLVMLFTTDVVSMVPLLDGVELVPLEYTPTNKPTTDPVLSA
jgi:hypothetical protein